ncbi:hypothetical protein Pyn_00068 [Prunus yedoensis var. nudiflora]|uniref:Uncharacterized protein n=1 Tax=Prunus yedoensis var. nudiflora TaxID=2094558 RepID=A0A314YW64_PRUYE|nr:hypothetical protein Pyn_00068 [Prunus yedoensis var. nudiflora]
MLFYGPGYRDQLTGVAATSLNPLYLTSSNQTSVSFKLSMLSAYVGNDMVKDISDGNTTTLSLKFGLVLSVWYSYRAHCSNMETPKPVSTTYFCNQIQVRDFGTGSLSTTTDHQPTACERS